MMARYNNYPFDEIVRAAVPIIERGEFDVFQKFTCQHCGERLTMATPNMLYMKGDCDRCGKQTDIARRGCNYLLVSKSPVMRKLLQRYSA